MWDNYMKRRVIRCENTFQELSEKKAMLIVSLQLAIEQPKSAPRLVSDCTDLPASLLHFISFLTEKGVPMYNLQLFFWKKQSLMTLSNACLSQC